jgi:hypothetical protein
MNQRSLNRSFGTWGPVTLFGLVAALALVTACSGGQGSAVPAPGYVYRTPLQPQTFRGRDHKRVRFDVAYDPEPIATGTVSGTYCYLNYFPTGPGDWPRYTCYLMQNDSVHFSNLWQTPQGSSHWTNFFYCSPTAWNQYPVEYDPTPNSVQATTSPNVTGNNWNCGRLDVVSVTISRGTDSGGWLDGYSATGFFTLCDSIDCAYPGGETAADYVIWPGPPPSPWPTPVTPPPGCCSPYPSPGPSDGLEIYDNFGKSVVSNGNVYIKAIGLEMSLTARTTKEHQPVPATWTYWVDSNRVAGQTFSTENAYDTLPTQYPTPSANTGYYWYTGTSSAYPAIVAAQATVDGQQTTALALFYVQAPTLYSMNATLTSPDIVQFHGTDFALGQPGVFGTGAGITSVYNIISPTYYGGWYAENQLIVSNPSPTPPGNFWATTPPNTMWDDGCWIENYGSSGQNAPAPYGSPGAEMQYGPTYDAPNFEVSNLPITGLSLNEPFQDSLLYFPQPLTSSDSSIWVTIGQLPWSWGGNVTLPAGGATGWKITTSFASPGPGGPSSWLPYWPHVLLGPAPGCPSTIPSGLHHKALRRQPKPYHPLLPISRLLKGKVDAHVLLRRPKSSVR